MSSQDIQALKPFIDRIRCENEIEADLVAKLHKEAYAEALRLGVESGKADNGLKKVVLFGSAV